MSGNRQFKFFTVVSELSFFVGNPLYNMEGGGGVTLGGVGGYPNEE